MTSKKNKDIQDKNRTNHMRNPDKQKAALAYAKRKIDDPVNEREPLTNLEGEAVVFLTQLRKDEQAAGEEGN